MGPETRTAARRNRQLGSVYHFFESWPRVPVLTIRLAMGKLSKLSSDPNRYLVEH